MGYTAESLAWAREQANAPYEEAKRKGIAQAGLRKGGERIDTALHFVTGHEPNGVLRAVAKARADAMFNLIRDYPREVTPGWINAQITALQAQAIVWKCGTGRDAEQLEGMVKRVCCHLWWRRQLKRVSVRTREANAQARGLVCVRTSQPYVTDETLTAYERARKDAQAMMEATEIESADGERITLWQAVMASTANLAIRRGELMTRIRGAEEWATAAGMVGIFTTNTLPSRFHSMHWKTGQQNHRYTGGESKPGAGNYGPVQPNGPREGQNLLCKLWARSRAAIAREGLKVFGFRVAEPHHDGCPHWHMLLWVAPEHLDSLQQVIRAHWLSDHPDEPGAEEHRFKAERIEASKGGAVAYVAKYIAKNIDDAGAVSAEGHRDEQDGEQVEIVEGGNKARRVMAWASAWGIRQFQAIGQPPVTVWRELRRVSDTAAQGASPTVQTAHAAVSKTSGRRACWRAYMDAQGGAMQGRAYAVRVLDDGEPREGRYGTEYRPRPVGVYDTARPDEWILSERREWKPKGSWAKAEREQMRGWAFAPVTAQALASPKGAQPWTRVINCTHRPRPQELFSLGIVGARASALAPERYEKGRCDG